MTPILTTKDRLMLRSRPWVLGIGVICAILIFAGISLNELVAGGLEAAKGPLIVLALFALVFAVFVRQEAVVFDRGGGEVIIRRVTVLGASEKRHPLTGLRRAEVERDANDSSDSRSSSKPLYRPVLVYANGPKVPLSEIFSSGSGAELAVKAINVWLQRKG